MIVLVAGGTGFLGKRVVNELQSRGHKTILYHRRRRAVPTAAGAIVNCVGIIKERGQTFEEAHVEVTGWLVGLGRKLNVRQFVQVSAIGADITGTPYQRTKAQAEMAVIQSGLPYAIVRPSMMFGSSDRSINLFRKICRTGFFPLFANGQVQPVHVDAVAKLVAAAVEDKVKNTVVEIGGPETFTYAELADRIHPGVRTFRLPRLFVWLFSLLGYVVPSLPTPDMVTMMGERNTTKDRTVGKLRIQNPRLT